jgi:hypothetical protein
MTWVTPPNFSWSASRSNVFGDCPRAYFCQYYLANGRAIDALPADVALAARLKRLTALPLWIGSRVHDTIEKMLRSARGGAETDIERTLADMVGQMRADYAASLLGHQVEHNGYASVARFHEHEYGRLPAREEWSRRVESAKAMIRGFARHGYLDQVREAGPGRVRALEELEDWLLDGVRIFVKIDLAFEDPEGFVHIVDWKTGQWEHGETPLQMLGYALFGLRRWNLPLERLKVKEVFLAKDDPDRPCTITPATLEQAEQTMRASIGAMLERLPDPRQDFARFGDFEPRLSPRCRSCNFLALCDDAAAYRPMAADVVSETNPAPGGAQAPSQEPERS